MEMTKHCIEYLITSLSSLSMTADQVIVFYKPVLVHTYSSTVDMPNSYSDSVYE
jgi:hypothetical protein